MANKYHLRISFYLRKGRANQKKECPIYIRIAVNNHYKTFSSNRFINSERWNSKSGTVSGNKEEVKAINTFLLSIKIKISQIYNDLFIRNEVITPDMLLEIFLGKKGSQKTLIDVFQYHNDKMQELVGLEYSEGTMERYRTSMMLTKQFMKEAYQKDDIYLTELKYPFITEYEHYLKAVRGNSHNTAAKYIKNFKKIIRLAVNNEWMHNDPFTKYSNPLKSVKRDYLTQEELKSIEEKEFSTERLSLVRDVFIFCCYTGLSYADIKKLTPNEVSKGLDGELWLFIERRKTGTDSHVPLLPKALELINKYKAHSEVKNSVFPVKSNQKMNAYLEEIATLCTINKKLTMHIARHTFGTLMLTLGVPIESVSSMLGHKNIRTTQHYSKIVKEKVSKDMNILRKKLKSG